MTANSFLFRKISSVFLFVCLFVVYSFLLSRLTIDTHNLSLSCSSMLSFKNSRKRLVFCYLGFYCNELNSYITPLIQVK